MPTIKAKNIIDAIDQTMGFPPEGEDNVKSTDKTKPTHADYLQLKKTTELNLRGLSIEWVVFDRTLQYATEQEERTRPKDYKGPAMLPTTKCDNEGNICKKHTPNTNHAPD